MVLQECCFTNSVHANMHTINYLLFSCQHFQVELFRWIAHTRFALLLQHTEKLWKEWDLSGNRKSGNVVETWLPDLWLSWVPCGPCYLLLPPSCAVPVSIFPSGYRWVSIALTKSMKRQRRKKEPTYFANWDIPIVPLWNFTKQFVSYITVTPNKTRDRFQFP